MKITKQNSLSLLLIQNLHVTFSERITLMILSEFSPDLFISWHIFLVEWVNVSSNIIFIWAESLSVLLGHCIHTLKTVLANSIHSINSGWMNKWKSILWSPDVLWKLTGITYSWIKSSKSIISSIHNFGISKHVTHLCLIYASFLCEKINEVKRSP